MPVGDGAPGPGRPKGSRNKVILQGESLAREILAQHDVPGILGEILKAQEPKVRLAALQFLWEQGYGKARQRLDIGNADAALHLVVKWANADDHAPAAPSGPDGDPAAPGTVQGGGGGPAVGEEPNGGGAVS